MNPSSTVQFETPISAARPPKTGRILVVDDSADNTFLVQAILEEEGYTVDVADSGTAALAKIAKNPPDLLLLDVMMPGMDGYEVTRRIRDKEQKEKLPFVPILLITAHDSASVSKGLDTGADDFIRKPVEFDELLARVRALLRLKFSVDERDQIARQREDFVSRLAHDLRTPLVAADRMMGLFQQGALGELSPDMHEAIATMSRSNQNLLQMVNTLLEVYRFEAGRKNFSFAPVNLIEVGREVIQELSPLIQGKNLKLLLETELPHVTVSADRLELRRVFTNLIENAIKFTDAGSVTLRIAQVAASDNPLGKPAAKLEVQDTGMGIPESDQVSLFERFRQGKHHRSGSGLGLYLSRRIVEVHQGSLQVQSQVGQGSTFTVYLPLQG